MMLPGGRRRQTLSPNLGQPPARNGTWESGFPDSEQPPVFYEPVEPKLDERNRERQSSFPVDTGRPAFPVYAEPEAPERRSVQESGFPTDIERAAVSYAEPEVMSRRREWDSGLPVNEQPPTPLEPVEPDITDELRRRARASGFPDSEQDTYVIPPATASNVNPPRTLSRAFYRGGPYVGPESFRRSEDYTTRQGQVRQLRTVGMDGLGDSGWISGALHDAYQTTITKILQSTVIPKQDALFAAYKELKAEQANVAAALGTDSDLWLDMEKKRTAILSTMTQLTKTIEQVRQGEIPYQIASGDSDIIVSFPTDETVSSGLGIVPIVIGLYALIVVCIGLIAKWVTQAQRDKAAAYRTKVEVAAAQGKVLPDAPPEAESTPIIGDIKWIVVAAGIVLLLPTVLGMFKKK